MASEKQRLRRIARRVEAHKEITGDDEKFAAQLPNLNREWTVKSVAEYLGLSRHVVARWRKLHGVLNARCGRPSGKKAVA